MKKVRYPVSKGQGVRVFLSFCSVSVAFFAHTSIHHSLSLLYIYIYIYIYIYMPRLVSLFFLAIALYF
jgi:hypothetical protein